MKFFITIAVLSLTTAVQAGEVKIIETETGVIAEYTGTASAGGSKENETTSPVVNNGSSDRVKYLASQIEQLKREAADMMKLTGNETEDELALKTALADEKKQQIETYNNEISQLTGNTQNNTVDTALPKEEQPLNHQSYRQEKKRQIRELKKLRMSPPSSTETQ